MVGECCESLEQRLKESENQARKVISHLYTELKNKKTFDGDTSAFFSIIKKYVSNDEIMKYDLTPKEDAYYGHARVEVAPEYARLIRTVVERMPLPSDGFLFDIDLRIYVNTVSELLFYAHGMLREWSDNPLIFRSTSSRPLKHACGFASDELKKARSAVY